MLIFFFINRNFLDFFILIDIIIIIQNKYYTYLIYINNKILINIFMVYSINKIEKSFFAKIFYII